MAEQNDDQLLAHRSGVGDYLNEEATGDIDDHILGVSFRSRFHRDSRSAWAVLANTSSGGLERGGRTPEDLDRSPRRSMTRPRHPSFIFC